MILVVECKADQALAEGLGVAPRQIEHFLGKGRVCNRLARLSNVRGMMDEDPGMTAPSYFQCLAEVKGERSIRLLVDTERNNQVVILRPRLEEWLVNSAKESQLKLTDFGFGSDHGIQLHSEINHRLMNLSRLLSALIEKKNDRLLYLQTILTHK